MALDRVHHPGGSAQVDVVARDVRDEPADRLSPERVAVGMAVVAAAPVTDDVQDTGAPVPGELLELVPEHEVQRVARAVDEREVAGVRGQRLEERAERRDPDPAGDERHLRPGPSRAGEDAVRAFDEDPRADRDRGEADGVIAQRLDRDPEPAAVGRRAERERVAAPPAVAGQEAEHEVLAGADGQLVEVAARDVDRDDARPSGTTADTRSRWRHEVSAGCPKRNVSTSAAVST